MQVLTFIYQRGIINVSSGQGEIPYRQYSLRAAMRLIRSDPGADGIVRMKEDKSALYALYTDLPPRSISGAFLFLKEVIMSHEEFMRKALDLAVKGMGFVSPNPMVGAVIVKDGRIVKAARPEELDFHSDEFGH